MSKIPEKIFFDKDSPFLNQMFNSDEYTKRQSDSDIEYTRSDLIPSWQPIETAPRDDKTYFLGFVQQTKEVDVMKTECNGRIFVIRYLERFPCHRPSHWMPLPEAPDA